MAALRGNLKPDDIAGSMFPGSIKGLVLPGAAVRPPTTPFLAAKSGVYSFDMYGELKSRVIDWAGLNRMIRALDGGIIVVALQVRKYNAQFEQEWWAGVNTGVMDIAQTSDGTIYVVTGSTTASVRKYSPTGQLLATFGFGSPQNSVAVDEDDNIWCGGSRANNISVRKIDPDGNILETRDTLGAARRLAFDVNGGLWVGTSRSSSVTLRVWTKAGVFVGQADTAANCNALYPAPDGGMYTGSSSSGSGTLRKYNPNLSVGWISYAHVANIFDITRDAAGNIFVLGDPDANGHNIKIFDQNHNLISRLSETSVGTGQSSIITN